MERYEKDIKKCLQTLSGKKFKNAPKPLASAGRETQPETLEILTLVKTKYKYILEPRFLPPAEDTVYENMLMEPTLAQFKEKLNGKIIHNRIVNHAKKLREEMANDSLGTLDYEFDDSEHLAQSSIVVPVASSTALIGQSISDEHGE